MEVFDFMDKNEFMTYKNKPLVRCGDVLFYGSMSDPYVVRIKIKTQKKVGDLDVADKVSIQLMSTDPNLSPRKQVIKSSEKNGLYNAMDFADVWLKRALKAQ